MRGIQVADILPIYDQALLRPSQELEAAIPEPQWYVVRTQYHKEKCAELSLASEGLTTFVPRIRAKKHSRNNAPETLPLFPQYIFVLFDAAKLLRRVAFTNGVSYVVSFAGVPAAIGEEVIALLRSRTEPDGCIRFGDTLHPGDHVYIKSGPFAAMLGVVERELSAKERVMVLLDALTMKLRVELPRAAVEKAA